MSNTTLPFTLPTTFKVPVNKVIMGNETLIDLTNDDVKPEDVTEGVVFHMANGEKAIGTRKDK